MDKNFMGGKFLRLFICRHGYEPIRYPMPEWYLLRNGPAEIFSTLRINCVIDAVANRGQYGEFLRNMGYRKHLASFEPIPAMFKVLEENSKNDPDWHVYNLALCPSNKTLDLNVTSSEEFTSLLPVNSYGCEHFQNRIVVERTERVNVVRLDSILDQVTVGLEDPRLYFKMDTQGNDLQVLEGLGDRLHSVLGLQSEIALRPICEWMPDYLTALARYNEQGSWVTSLVLVSRENLPVIEYDCLMIRDSHRAPIKRFRSGAGGTYRITVADQFHRIERR
jgi:FkbM family methyltransferase